MTTQDDIRAWFRRGIKPRATHMIVAVDRFDHSDYPVWVRQVPESEPESPNSIPRVVHDVKRLVAEAFSGQNMQGCMEVYSYSLPIEGQLSEHRAFHY